MVTSILLCDFVSETIYSKGFSACIHSHTADLQLLLATHSSPTPWEICWALPIQRYCSLSENPGCETRKACDTFSKLVAQTQVEVITLSHYSSGGPEDTQQVRQHNKTVPSLGKSKCTVLKCNSLCSVIERSLLLILGHRGLFLVPEITQQQGWWRPTLLAREYDWQNMFLPRWWNQEGNTRYLLLCFCQEHS